MGKPRYLYDNVALEGNLYVSSARAGVVTAALKDGDGSAVITVSGTYTGTVDREYLVEIDTVGTGEVGSSTFKWSRNGGSSWQATGVVTSSSYLTLENGIQVKWTSGSGADFALNDKWYFKAINLFKKRNMIDSNRDSRFRTGSLDATNWVDIDLGSAQEVKALVLYDHNLTGSATVTLKAQDTALVGELLAEDCGSLAAWTDASTGGGSSGGASAVTQTTFDGEECFKFVNAEVAASGSGANIYRDLGSSADSFGTDTTLEFQIYFAELGADLFELSINLSSTLRFRMAFNESGGNYKVYVHDGSTYNEVGAGIVEVGTWQTWRVVIDHTTESSAECSVYLAGELVEDEVDCSDISSNVGPDGRIDLYYNGDAEAVQPAYLNYLYIDDGEYPEQGSIEAGANWSSPDLSESVTVATGKILHYLAAATTKRWWRVEIADTDNSDGYIEIGELFLGGYFEPSKGMTYGSFKQPRDFIGETDKTPAGIRYRYFRNWQESFTLTMSNLLRTDVDAFQAIMDVIADKDTGIIRPIIFNVDSAEVDDFWLVDLESLPVAWPEDDYYNIDLALIEVLTSK